MTRDTGGPAFPRGDYHPNGDGMSLRDWFAGQALSGFGVKGQYAEDAPTYARRAYVLADAMLAERAKP